LVQTGDVSLYAFDQHTRLGREAIWRFARENPAVRSCLARYFPERCWRGVAYEAASTPTSRHHRRAHSLRVYWRAAWPMSLRHSAHIANNARPQNLVHA
jgi:hypothetical protein